MVSAEYTLELSKCPSGEVARDGHAGLTRQSCPADDGLPMLHHHIIAIDDARQCGPYERQARVFFVSFVRVLQTLVSISIVKTGVDDQKLKKLGRLNQVVAIE